MKTISASFQTSSGHSLAARLDRPESEAPRAYALIAHCFTCSKDYKGIVNIARVMTERGWGVFRFDFTGLGQSGGAFEETTFTSNVEDLLAAAQFMERDYAAPKLLLGHSLGGAAVLQAAEFIPSCTAVVTLAAPHNPGHLADLLSHVEEDIEKSGEAEVTIGGQAYRIRKAFLESLRHDNWNEVVANLGRALLILHSPKDATVDIDNAAKLFQAARHPKSFVSLDTADHLLSNEADARYAGEVIAAWARRYVKME
jgi:putative redox protein